MKPTSIRRGALKFGAALLVVLSATGQARAQSLADALVTAYLNSPELARERANLKVASELAVQARSQGLPNIEGVASVDSELRDFDEVLFPTVLALDLQQAIYTGGQVENATEAAVTRISAQEALIRSTEQQVLLDAVTAYVDVVRDLAFVDLGINNVRVLSEQLRAARERFEVGEVTRTDVEQARAFLAAARSSLAAARGSLAASREAYLRAIGKPPSDLAPLPPLPDVPEDLEAAIALALVNDPALLSARIEREASGSDVRAAIGALLPQVSLRGSLSRTDTLRDTNAFGGGIPAVDRASVGVQVTIPFYRGGFNYSNIREAQAIVERNVADVTASERIAIQNVGLAWAQLQVARASIESGRLEVEASRLAFEGVQEEAKVGARTTLDVLDAEEDLLQARTDLVAARRDETVAIYRLLASIGLLTVQHLGLDTGLPETASYYESVRSRNFGYDATEDTVWTTRWRP